MSGDGVPTPDSGVPGTLPPPVVPEKKRFRRIRALLAKLPQFDVSTTKGKLLAFFSALVFGVAICLGLFFMVSYTETAAFCSACHTMAPEMKAYELSAHREVPCAECHVEPGIGGWVKAKAAGTKQLIQIITRTYPEPIPAPDHQDLPSVDDTCMECHSLESITANGGPVKLVLRPRYQTDEKNTRDLVAVALRPIGLNSPATTATVLEGDQPKGVHWHVEQEVDFTASDERSQEITSVTVHNDDGTTTQYIAGDQVRVPERAGEALTKLEADEKSRTMDCIDCHNRAGHGLPSIGEAVDGAISGNKISTQLPYIKKYSVDLLDRNYESLDEANAAIAGLRQTYEQEYPKIAAAKTLEIDQAIRSLQVIYAELATPEMKVQIETYPDNLGHQTSPGCFRCHDGAHFKVVDGKLTGKTIPSSCSTCHTFPQIGGSITGILIGGSPPSHADDLYVFDHKDAPGAIEAEQNAAAKKLPAGSVDPAGTDCGTCHQRNYCESCHRTGAIKVTHDEMLYNHAASIRKSGGQACAYCHQPVYCAGCHNTPVLDFKPIITEAAAWKPRVSPVP